MFDFGDSPIRQGNEWIFSDGTRLPVVSGSSDDLVLNPSGEDGNDDPFEGLSEFGKSYLEREVQDENLRRQMAPHVKNWDRGANAKFQEIHQQYRPFRDLGDIETVQQHINFTRRFNADPEGTLALLLQHEVITPAQLQKLLGTSGLPAQDTEESDDLEAKIWKKFEQKFGSLEQNLQGVTQNLTQFQQSQQLEQGKAELEKAIQGLRQKHGDDFHEDLTLAMAAQLNIPLDQAHEMVSKQINGYVQKKIPPRAGFTMPGTGSGASFNKKPEELSDADERKAYIAQRLMQMNQGQ